MSLTVDRIKQQMLANAREITRLNTRIHETFANRDKSQQSQAEWKNACTEFHGSYGELAFPGGYDGAIERILLGEAAALEAALCFLECRPYFFRSGYMYKEILLKTKRAPLNEEQAERLKVVLQRQADWRARKQILNVRPDR